MRCLVIILTFVSNQSHNHGVQIEKEHEQMETELDEGLALVDVQFAEDLGRVEEVLIVKDPVISMLVGSSYMQCAGFW